LTGFDTSAAARSCSARCGARPARAHVQTGLLRARPERACDHSVGVRLTGAPRSGALGPARAMRTSGTCACPCSRGWCRREGAREDKRKSGCPGLYRPDQTLRRQALHRIPWGAAARLPLAAEVEAVSGGRLVGPGDGLARALARLRGALRPTRSHGTLPPAALRPPLCARRSVPRETSPHTAAHCSQLERRASHFRQPSVSAVRAWGGLDPGHVLHGRQQRQAAHVSWPSLGPTLAPRPRLGAPGRATDRRLGGRRRLRAARLGLLLLRRLRLLLLLLPVARQRRPPAASAEVGRCAWGCRLRVEQGTGSIRGCAQARRCTSSTVHNRHRAPA